MRPADFAKRAYGHQRRLDVPICSTDAIYAEARALFREVWRGDPIRNMGIHFNEITDSNEGQLSLFGCGPSAEPDDAEDHDKAVDSIRERFGAAALKRGL
jgi:DNA polymerase-4